MSFESTAAHLRQETNLTAHPLASSFPAGSRAQRGRRRGAVPADTPMPELGSLSWALPPRRCHGDPCPAGGRLEQGDRWQKHQGDVGTLGISRSTQRCLGAGSSAGSGKGWSGEQRGCPSRHSRLSGRRGQGAAYGLSPGGLGYVSPFLQGCYFGFLQKVQGKLERYYGHKTQHGQPCTETSSAFQQPLCSSPHHLPPQCPSLY